MKKSKRASAEFREVPERAPTVKSLSPTLKSSSKASDQSFDRTASRAARECRPIELCNKPWQFPQG